MDELPAYSPQTIHDLLPIYRPPNATLDHIHTYTLRQTSASTQTLSSTEEFPTAIPPLHIKSFKTGGFMNRKPHIIISSHPGRAVGNGDRNRNRKPPSLVSIAEARFDIHDTGTSIIYHPTTTITTTTNDNDSPSDNPDNGNTTTSRTQRLELADPRHQVLRTVIQDIPCTWQPLRGNKDVLELSNEYDDVIARFVHLTSTPPTSTFASASTSTNTSPRIGTGSTQRSNSIFSLPIFGTSNNTSSAAVSGSEDVNTSTTGAKKTKTQKSKAKSKSPDTEIETAPVIGELHVVASPSTTPLASTADEAQGEEQERKKDERQKEEEILCSAVVVMERMRRRRKKLEVGGCKI